MNYYLLLCAGAVAASCLSACDRSPPPARTTKTASKTLQTGVASFYHKDFAGRKTASGERLRLGSMTAASRTLPLGSQVQVVNAKTGQGAIVRINDRGPYAKGRVLDLTPAAARHIGIESHDGVAPVSIKSLPTSQETAP